MLLVDEDPLDPHLLGLNTQEAAAAFITASIAAHAMRSYLSAVAYWSAWRNSQALGNAPLQPSVAIPFVLDHLSLPLEDGTWPYLMPPGVDAALVTARVKTRLMLV